MSEKQKFGETRLQTVGKIPDPFYSTDMVNHMRGIMGEGRVPFSQLPQGVSIIDSNSGSRLRLKLEDTFIGLGVVEPRMISDFDRATYFFVARVDPQTHSLELNINNKNPNNSQEKHPDIHPDVLLDEAFLYFSSIGSTIHSIGTQWQPGSDNYDTLTRLVASGMSREEAASHTWTGKQASKRKYTIHNSQDIQERGGNIHVLFSQ